MQSNTNYMASDVTCGQAALLISQISTICLRRQLVGFKHARLCDRNESLAYEDESHRSWVGMYSSCRKYGGLGPQLLLTAVESDNVVEAMVRSEEGNQLSGMDLGTS